MKKSYAAIAVVLALTSAECAQLSEEGQKVYDPTTEVHTTPDLFQPTPTYTPDPRQLHPLPSRGGTESTPPEEESQPGETPN